MSLDNILQQSLEISKKLGIKKFDISGSQKYSATAKVQNGAVETMNASNKSAITVRVWQGASVGTASCADLSQEGITYALDSAKSVAPLMEQSEPVDFSPEAMEKVEINEPEIEDVAPGKLAEKLLEVEAECFKKQSAIQTIAYNGLSDSQTDAFYVNSDGANRKQKVAYSFVYLAAQAQEEGKRMRNSFAVSVAPQFQKLDCQSVIDEIVEKITMHLNYEKLSSGKYLCVFSPKAILDLLESFSNIWNARDILDGQSLSTLDSLGKEISSPLLNVFDEPFHPNSYGALSFDGEGTPCRKVGIIESGNLKNFLHSSATAKKMSANLTGNAVMGSKIRVGENFLTVCGSSDSSDKLSLKDCPDPVVYIDDLKALHAGIQALQGSFSLPFEGFLYKNGECVSIEQGVVAGDFKQVLKSIVSVGKDQIITPSGAAPDIWVEGLSITGS